jgi:hypothetical protein
MINQELQRRQQERFEDYQAFERDRLQPVEYDRLKGVLATNVLLATVTLGLTEASAPRMDYVEKETSNVYGREMAATALSTLMAPTNEIELTPRAAAIGHAENLAQAA